MNEEDTKAFEEWAYAYYSDFDFPNQETTDAWQAAIEYERSRLAQPMTIINALKRMPEFSIYGTQEGIDWINELCTECREIKARIAELEAAKPAHAQESAPERVFTPCPEHFLATSMRANTDGEHWGHCPWCGKSLWRTRKVVQL